MVNNNRKNHDSARQSRESLTPQKRGRDKETKIGTVIEALPNATFRVRIENEASLVFAHLSGKMRMYRIKVLVGDHVKMEIDEYDSTKGKIIQRL